MDNFLEMVSCMFLRNGQLYGFYTCQYKSLYFLGIVYFTLHGILIKFYRLLELFVRYMNTAGNGKYYYGNVTMAITV